ncbi:MAG: type II toxin-antitoxin system HicB family antitoxin [bacterium]
MAVVPENTALLEAAHVAYPSLLDDILGGVQGATLVISLEWDNEGAWFVRIPEFSGCMSQGDTVPEAIAMILEAAQGWLEVAMEDGDL